MPKMNGKEAYDEIRKIKPGIKVIFASGYPPDILQETLSLATGHRWSPNPFLRSDLVKKVRSVLDRAK